MHSGCSCLVRQELCTATLIEHAQQHVRFDCACAQVLDYLHLNPSEMDMPTEPVRPTTTADSSVRPGCDQGPWSYLSAPLSNRLANTHKPASAQLLCLCSAA